MGKKLSEEHKAKLAAGREAARARKLAEAEKVVTGKTPEPTTLPEPVAEPVQPADKSNASYSELLNTIEELKANQAFMQQMIMQNGNQPAQGQQPAFNSNGLVGTRTKFIVDPAYYNDPTIRLRKEPRLQQFAFDMNYTLDWEVNTSSYETKDNVNTEEPRFNIQLNRIVRDPATGEDTNGRYIVCRGVFFEDPQTAIVIARQNGIDVNEFNEKDFLEEMRYIRIRDWLMEAFYPPVSTDAQSNKKQMVVNGKLVEYFEVNSEQSAGIPFGDLKTKV